MIDISYMVSDDDLEKFGFTKKTFKGSNLELLFESMIFAFEKTVDEETKRLMKEYSLSFGEARNIAFNIVKKSIILNVIENEV